MADERRGEQALRPDIASGFRQLPVIGADQKIVGFLEESEVTRAYLSLSTRRREAST